MKKIIVSFEVNGQIANDKDVNDVVKSIRSMLQIFGRNNGLCIDNVCFATKQVPTFHEVVCKGERCVLKDQCMMYKGNWHCADKTVINYCDPETRELYVPKNK